ncbi:MAG TPA: RNA methyltransferase [Candidatus Kryptonia bacterium]
MRCQLSLTNAELKILSALKDRTERHRQKRFLIEGKRSVTDALKANASVSRLILSLGSRTDRFTDVLSLAEQKEIEVVELPADKFRKLTTTETSQGIIAVGDILESSVDEYVSKARSKRQAILIILDRIADPGNLGTILRSAVWFGVEAVITAQGSVDVYNPKVVRSAMSALASLQVIEDADLGESIAALKKIGFKIIASSQDGRDEYTSFDYPPKIGLVFGSEATGIRNEILSACDWTVSIPRRGKMESLNVAVAASIVLAEMWRQTSSRVVKK